MTSYAYPQSEPISFMSFLPEDRVVKKLKLITKKENFYFNDKIVVDLALLLNDRPDQGMLDLATFNSRIATLALGDLVRYISFLFQSFLSHTMSMCIMHIYLFCILFYRTIFVYYVLLILSCL